MRSKFLRSKRFILSSILIVIAGFVIIWSAAGIAKIKNKKLEPITVSYSPFESAALLLVAAERNYFDQNGLEINLRKYDTGAAALDGMLKKEADIADVADFPVARKVLQPEKIQIIGNIDIAEFIYLVGRKDKGITAVPDLIGKKIGTTFGTVSHFHLGKFLDINGIKLTDVNLIDLKTPDEWVNAVANGEIDAVATAQPYADVARERLGDNAVFWPIQNNQPLYSLLIATDEWIENNHKTVKKFLISLIQAEEYLVRHPVEAKAIVKNRLNLENMEVVWSRNQFALNLGQSLIISLEDEMRWLMANKLTDKSEMPNLLDYIYIEALEEVRPEAMTIIK